MTGNHDFQNQPSLSGKGRGAPVKWPFLDMKVDQLERVENSADFASARSAVSYARKVKGFDIITRLKDGVLFVKRMK